MEKVKQYDEKCKRQFVQHVLQIGKAVAQVARGLEISVTPSWLGKEI
ncbi:hypothetical protein [Bacillus cereus]|nr:hypothetical protein [Bacillus cereus]